MNPLKSTPPPVSLPQRPGTLLSTRGLTLIQTITSTSRRTSSKDRRDPSSLPDTSRT